MAILRKNIEEKAAHVAILSLGGNLGDVKGMFTVAIDKLSESGKILKISSLYETEAWGMKGAPPFLNQIVVYQTKRGPQDLLKSLLQVEESLGRNRGQKEGDMGGYQSRSIDIDILFYDDLVLQEGDLEIPHPRLHLRKFVLEPMNEIMPQWEHPVFGKSIERLRSDLRDTSEVKKL